MTTGLGYRKFLLRLLTFLGGIYFFLEFALPQSAVTRLHLDQYHDDISYGFVVVGSMAIGLGLINLFLVHGSRIVFRRKDWTYSAVLLCGLLSMMSITTVDWLANLRISSEVEEISLLAQFARKIRADHETKHPGVPGYSFRNRKLFEAGGAKAAELRAEFLEIGKSPADLAEDRLKIFWMLTEVVPLLDKLEREQSPTPDFEANDEVASAFSNLAAESGKLRRAKYQQGLNAKLFQFLFEGLFVSLGSAIFSLLAVYIAAAAFRAFRVQSFESSLMLGAALLVMLGQIPFGLWISEDLPAWRLWLLKVPNSAAFRAIEFGAAIAGLVLAFRMWFSIESESFSPEVRSR